MKGRLIESSMGTFYNPFYHFTAKRLVNSIKKTGLSRGCIPVSIKPARLLFNYQWITKNPSFNQEWARGTGALPYKRNEVRFDVYIPNEHKDKLFKFSECRHLCPELFDDLVSDGDPENWFVYHGFIPNGWLRNKTINPEIGEK